MITMPQPPISVSSVQQLNGYLIQLTNYLNVALNRINSENFAPEFREALAEISASIQSNKTAEERGLTQFNSLKSLIIKTADTIYETMDTEFKEFEGKYVAVSDFGTFEQEVSRQRTEDANATQDEFSNVQEVIGKFKLSIGASIRTGNLGLLDEQTDQYGIGIGQYSVLQDDDGNVIYDDTKSNNYCTITATKMTFWDNGVAVAYISNNKLYINNAHLNKTLDIGYTDGGDGKWRITGESGKGFVIKWIGGDV